MSIKGAAGDDTARIAGLFAARITAAKERLAAEMKSRGLRADAGWRIHEEMLNTPEGLAVRLRPIHRTDVPPDDLEKLISLD